jgi:hypothetical protein
MHFQLKEKKRKEKNHKINKIPVSHCLFQWVMSGVHSEELDTPCQ